MKKFILTPVLLLAAVASLNAGSAGIDQLTPGEQSLQVTLPNDGTYSLYVYTASAGGFAFAQVGDEDVEVAGVYQAQTGSGAIAAGTYTLTVDTTSTGAIARASVAW